jgi:hypothetical protein
MIMVRAQNRQVVSRKDIGEVVTSILSEFGAASSDGDTAIPSSYVCTS